MVVIYVKSLYLLVKILNGTGTINYKIGIIIIIDIL